MLTLALNGSLAAAASGTGLRDIRGPLPLVTPPPFLWTGLVLLLVVVLWLWRLKWQRKWRRTRSDAAQSSLSNNVGPTPDRLLQLAAALAELAAEYRRGARTRSEMLLLLDGLLRAAIAAQSTASAQHLTSAELLGLAVRWPSQTRAVLSDLLPLFDRVKFAGLQPDAEQAEMALAATAGVIDALRARRTP